MDRIAHALSNPKKMCALVVGLSQAGVQAALALKKLGAEVIATDRVESLPGLDQLSFTGVHVELGGDRTELLHKATFVVLSPEIQLRPQAAPIPAKAVRRGLPIVGELELAYRLLAMRASGPPKLLAVTGTNGKSSTVALCAHMLTQAGQRVFASGALNSLATLFLNEEQAAIDWAVIDVSAFQLEHLSGPGVFVPQIGIWLNLTPRNLDRHLTIRNYGRKKRSLFEGMTSSQTGVFWLDDSNVNQHHEGLECSLYGASRNPARVPHRGVLLIREEITPNGWNKPFVLANERLRGDHNAENAACAVCAALSLDIPAEVIQSGLDSFPGLPHRLEPIGEARGVLYVDDAFASTPEATAKSLTAFKKPVVLLIGDSRAEFGQLAQVVSKRARQVIVFGAGGTLAQALEAHAAVLQVPTLEAALREAAAIADTGETVLLSPASCPGPPEDLARAFAKLIAAK